MDRPSAFEFLSTLKKELETVEETDSEAGSDVSDVDSDVEISTVSSCEDDISGDDTEVTEEEEYLSRNKLIRWSTQPSLSHGRKPRHCVMNEVTGPAPHVTPQDVAASLSYYLTDDMLDKVVNYSNEEAQRRTAENWLPLCVQELRAFLGILYLMGTLRGSRQRVRDFWDAQFGQNAIIAAMSRNRFLDILRYLRFDSKGDRAARAVVDRLAPIRELWEMLRRNCRRCIIPGRYLAVDEFLLPTKGRCSFRIFMAGKPHKYGIKIFVLCDENGFFVDGVVYLGRRVGERREVDQAFRVVSNFLEPYYESGRNVTTDNFYSSFPLAQHLLEHGVSFLGTMRMNKPEIPSAFLSKQRPHKSSIVAYSGPMQLTSFMGKPRKCVVILSTLHHTTRIVEQTPQSVLDYNCTKGFVDVNNQMANTMTTRRKVNRWPVTLFCHILDVCGINAYLTWLQRHPHWQEHSGGYKHAAFIKELSFELMKPWMHMRVQVQPKCVHSNVRFALEACGVLGEQIPLEHTADHPAHQRGRCHMCKHNRRRVYSCCDICHRHVCATHSNSICNMCRE